MQIYNSVLFLEYIYQNFLGFNRKQLIRKKTEFNKRYNTPAMGRCNASEYNLLAKDEISIVALYVPCKNSSDAPTRNRAQKEGTLIIISIA
jgi:hypothetical protein